MKERIAEKGRVVGVEGDIALVRLEGGRTCRKCGLAAMGICKPGGTGMTVRATNVLRAGTGDSVTLAISGRVRRRGYLLAYIVPLLCFVAGAFAGYTLSLHTRLNGLEVVMSFAAAAVGALYSLPRIKAMDNTERMYVHRILKDVPDFDGRDRPRRRG